MTSNHIVEYNEVCDPLLIMKAYLLVPTHVRLTNISTSTNNPGNSNDQRQEFIFNQIFLPVIGNKDKYDNHQNEFDCKLKLVYSFNHNMRDSVFKIKFNQRLSLSKLNVVCDVSWRCIDTIKPRSTLRSIPSSSQIVKMLLLGQSGSGKSVVCEQLKLYLTKSSEMEKIHNTKSEAHSIQEFIVETIKHTLELIRHKNDDNHIGPQDTGYDVYFEDLSPEAQIAGMYFIEIENLRSPRFEGKNDELVQHIQTLWNESKFRDVYRKEVCCK